MYHYFIHCQGNNINWTFVANLSKSTVLDHSFEVLLTFSKLNII